MGEVREVGDKGIDLLHLSCYAILTFYLVLKYIKNTEKYSDIVWCGEII